METVTDERPDWESRFRAGRVGLPDWALDAPQRCVVEATAAGVLELHSWDREAGSFSQLTSRKEGTSYGAIDPSGDWIWWFDDADGDEFGIWRRQAFGSAPAENPDPATDLEPSYPAGLALGRNGLAVVGRSDDGYGTQIHLVPPGQASRLLYQHEEDAGVAGLSEDGTLLAISHSEHGDSRHPALRIMRTADGSTVAELWDGPGLGLDAAGFAPIAGDPRLLVLHERHGKSELLVWNTTTGEQRELNIDVPGEVSSAEWFLDGKAVLLSVDYQARTRLIRLQLEDTESFELGVHPVGPSDGTVLASTCRPGGDVWLLWSSAATPPAVRTADGEIVLAPPGSPAPASVPIEDVWVEGPGGRIHALLRRPASTAAALPLLVDVHGGPTWHDPDAFRAYPSAWVDHGYAVVQVNYRGSTGYGSAWRDALEARIGHVELEDIVAVRDYLVDAGIADPDRIVLGGASWGGFLTLLGLGLHPDKWSLGLASVPVADYVAAFDDEMEGLKAFDRSLFGGTPEEVPEKYRDSSPITYIDSVRAPVLILAGENDPRCPIRQIENYLTALTERGLPFAVYRYDAGHGSLVDDEKVRQMRTELDFAAQQLGS